MASAPESAHQQRGESPLRTEHWLSEAEGNCVVERRGGEQPEANCQSINKTMLNSIRPDALASLLAKGEARNRMPTRRGQGDFGELRCGQTVSATAGMHGVVGAGMARSWSDVNQGSRFGERNGVHGPEARRTGPEGDRASIGAKKRGNARGAKGGREAEASGRAKGTKQTAESAPKGAEPGRGRRTQIWRWSVPPQRNCLWTSKPARVWMSLHLSLHGLVDLEPEQPASWKAGCGKSARPVWEGGRFYPAPTSSTLARLFELFGEIGLKA
jgi:hypothetical protein